MPSVRELVLFAHALRLARKAQAIEREPLARVLGRLTNTRRLPRHVTVSEAEAAALRATSRGARWFGWRDTCLVRAMVLSALLSGGGGVELVIGVRGQASVLSLDAHAWVRTPGREVSLMGAGTSADAAYDVLKVMPVTR